MSDLESTPNFETGSSQFAVVAKGILKVMQSHDRRAFQLEVDPVVALSQAQLRLEAGDLAPPASPEKVVVYKGQQKSIIENFYSLFNGMTIELSRSYADLKSEMSELFAAGQTFIEGPGAYKDLVRGDRLALADSHGPTGLQMKITENIHAFFLLGDISQAAPEVNSTVGLLVADIES